MPATTPRPCSSRRRLTLVAAASLAISIATTACGHLNAPESRVDTSESTSTAVAVEVDSAAVPPTRTPTRPRPPAPTPRPTRTRAPTRAPAPTPTPVPTWTPVALPPESPVDGLSGRIVWHNRLGTVYEMDLSARTHRKLWSESGHVRDLAVAPGGLEAAYVVARTPAEESVVIRALEPEASGRVVATDVNTATTLTRPAWSPDGADVVFGVFGEDNLFTESFDHCAFHAIARDGSAERTLWSGSTADFPRSFGCPWQFLWEPVDRKSVV